MKLLNKFLSLLSLFAILFLQVAVPLQVLAQDASPLPEVTSSPTPEPSETPATPNVPEISPAPTEIPTLNETPSPTSTPAPSSDENNSSTTVDETGQSNAPPAPDSARLTIDLDTSSQTASATLIPPLWQTNPDGSVTTTDPVSLNTTYKAPQNDKVTVTFTKLPENPGTLTIKEVKLSQAKRESLNAFSDIAYDITSDMEDGTFEYDLTLPLPPSAQGQNVEVKAGESVDTLDQAETLDEPKTTTNDVIKITGLNHFTIFVLVNDTTGITDGMLTTIKDAWLDETAANQDVNHGNATTLLVQSRDGGRNQRALVQFNLSSIPAGSTINNAKVRLYMTVQPSSNRTYQIYRITSNDWVEGDGGATNSPAGEVSWDNLDGGRLPLLSFAGSPTSSANVLSTDPDGWVEFNVASDITAFLSGTANYGWLIKDVAETESSTASTITFASRENGTDNHRPQLSVDFTQSNNVNGFNSPLTDSLVTGTGDGDGYGTNPTNAFASDETFAVDTNSGATVNDDCTTNGVDRHMFNNYGFSVPVGATVNGIEVRQDLKVDSLTDSPFTCVELSWNGGTTWTSLKQSSLTSTNLTPYYFGSATDTWGRTWSASDFSNANFKVRVSNGDTDSVNGSTTDFSLDWVPVRVYYTPDTTAPAAFQVGSIITTGGTVVASKWNASNTGVNVTVPVANDSSLTGGTIQLRAEADSSFENVGSAYTILVGDLNGNKTLSLTAAQLEAIAGFSEGDNVTVRAVITDIAGNATTGSASATSLDVDQTAPVVNITSPVTGNQVKGSKIITFTDGESTSPQCSIDNSTFVNCTSGVTTLSDITGFNALGQGNFTLYLKDTDAAGNTGTTSQVNVVKDSVNPTPPGTPTSEPTPTNNNTPTWGWTAATDDFLSHYIFFWDSVMGGEANDSGNLSSSTLDFTIPVIDALMDGTWYGKVKAFDSAGNSSTSDDGSVVVDTTPTDAPTSVNLTSPINLSNITAANVVLTGNGEANATVNYTITDESSNDFSGSGTVDNDGNINIGGIDVSELEDGELTVSVTLTDAAGNISLEGTDTATKDTVAPNMPGIPTVAGDNIINSNELEEIVVEGTAEVNSSVSVRLEDNGEEEFCQNNVTENGTADEDGQYSITLDGEDLCDGTIYVTVTAQDGAGNVSEEQTTQITQDTDAPTGSLNINDGASYTNSTNVVLAFSGVSEDTVLMQVGGGSFVAYENPFQYTLLSEDQTNQSVQVVLVDSAGNVSETIVDYIIFDSISPVISNVNITNLTTLNDSFVKNGDLVRLTATITDSNPEGNLSTSNITANLSSLKPDASGYDAVNPVTYNPDTGLATWDDLEVSGTVDEDVTVTVDANDLALNTATQGSVTIDADSTVPTVNLNMPLSDTTSISSVTVIGTTNEAATCTYSLDGGADTAMDTTGETSHIKALSGLEPGSHSIQLTCTDSSGNSSTSSTINWTVIDFNNIESDVIFDSATEGQADLPEGITTINLSNDTNLDLSAGVNTASGDNITIGGVVMDLSDFTSGDITDYDFSVPQSIGGISFEVEKAVILQSGTDNEPIILTNSDLSNVNVSIPDGASVLAPNGWDGTIQPPKTVSSSGTAPSGFSVGSTIIEVGSPDAILLFDKPVDVILTGVTGPVGYKSAGSTTWIQITNTCGGTYASPTSPTFPGECAISDGTNTKIITYHFTTFGSLNTVSSSSSSSTSTSGGGGNDGGDGLGCATHDCSGIHPAPQNLVLGVSTSGPAAGFAPGVLGVTSKQGNVGIGEKQGQVQGEATASGAQQPSATVQPQGAGSSPVNVKTIAIVVIILLLGFGVFSNC